MRVLYQTIWGTTLSSQLIQLPLSMHFGSAERDSDLCLDFLQISYALDKISIVDMDGHIGPRQRVHGLVKEEDLVIFNLVSHYGILLSI